MLSTPPRHANFGRWWSAIRSLFACCSLGGPGQRSRSQWYRWLRRESWQQLLRFPLLARFSSPPPVHFEPRTRACHFHANSKKGGIRDSYLIRYRRNGLPISDFQDEREERLCNAFAEEFLLPTEALRHRDFSSDITPQQIQSIASEFQISMQAVAVKCSKIFSPRRLVCSLWSLKTPWPVAAWWTGGDSWFKKKWLLKSDIAIFEQLARICALERRELTEIGTARGNRKFDLKIRIAPTNSREYAIAVLSPFKPPCRVPALLVQRHSPLQLDLFRTSSAAKRG